MISIIVRVFDDLVLQITIFDCKCLLQMKLSDQTPNTNKNKTRLLFQKIHR